MTVDLDFSRCFFNKKRIFDGVIGDSVFLKNTAGKGEEESIVDSSSSDGETPDIRPDSNYPVGYSRSQKKMLIQPGAIIDKYQIDALLGKGGFAVVYRATHRILQTTVALKIIKPNLSRQYPQLIRSVCEEARFAAQINHPNVVKIYDVTGNKKLSYIVMEYIDGQSLMREIKQKKRIGVQNSCMIIQEVCHGLNAALEQGLIHRDIKPENIIVPRDGSHIRIVDLGLASKVELKRSKESEGTDKHQNNFGEKVLGTPAYMPPEQALDPDSRDHCSDIYSLGVTLYTMLCGKLPYRAESVSETIRMHIEAPIPLAHQEFSDIPTSLSVLIARMMSKQPQDRPQSYNELISELNQWTQEEVGAGGLRSWVHRLTSKTKSV